jgi:hypothetical protein
MFVGDFAPDVRSGPRTKLCARPGAHRHEQEIADRANVVNGAIILPIAS